MTDYLLDGIHASIYFLLLLILFNILGGCHIVLSTVQKIPFPLHHVRLPFIAVPEEGAHLGLSDGECKSSVGPEF